MHLYNKAITSITWSNVEQFCDQGVTENAYLDYKRDFPSDLSKTIAAMANTFGGLILIGIDETDTGAPQLPLQGIEFQRGLEERVINTIVDTMTPPVIPEIVICPNDATNRAIIVIRITQSELAPHALHRNSYVYIRTGNRNTPEDIADLDRIDWLREHRKKAENLREQLFSRACIRFRDLREGNVGGVTGTDEGRWMLPAEQPGLLTIALCPMYPDRILVQPSKFNVVSRVIMIRDYMGTSEEFPLQGPGCISRMVEDGFVMHISGRGGGRTYHTHLNMYGLFLFRQSLMYEIQQEREGNNQGGNARLVFRGREIIARLYEVVESGKLFYERIGYWGPLKFRLRLEGLLGTPMLMPNFDTGGRANSDCFSADDQIDTANIVQSANLEDGKHEAVLSLFEYVGWAYNTHVTLDTLRAYYSENCRR